MSRARHRQPTEPAFPPYYIGTLIAALMFGGWLLWEDLGVAGVAAFGGLWWLLSRDPEPTPPSRMTEWQRAHDEQRWRRDQS